MAAEIDPIKKLALFGIMQRVHALADCAWPRDARGVSAMPHEALELIIDIQNAAAEAIGLPAKLDLMTGIEEIDFISYPPASFILKNSSFDRASRYQAPDAWECLASAFPCDKRAEWHSCQPPWRVAPIRKLLVGPSKFGLRFSGRDNALARQLV